MFNKLNKLGLVLIIFSVLILLFAVPSYSATLTATIGDQNSSGKYRVEVDTDGVFTFQTDTGINFPYQSGTTNDTLTAADSGRTYVTSSGTVSAVVITVPTAVPGMVFPFITGTTHALYILPQSTDTINYASLAAGSSIFNSTAAKGDSIKLICVIANIWDVEISNGTWADGVGFTQ